MTKTTKTSTSKATRIQMFGQDVIHMERCRELVRATRQDLFQARDLSSLLRLAGELTTDQRIIHTDRLFDVCVAVGLWSQSEGEDVVPIRLFVIAALGEAAGKAFAGAVG